MRRLSKSAPRLAAIIMLLLLPTGYMGAYYGSLKGHRIGRIQADLAERLPEYRSSLQAVAIIFIPAHQLDRALRPGRWAPEPIP